MNFEHTKQKDESHGSSVERQKLVTEQLVPGCSSASRMPAQHAPSLEFPSTIQAHHGSLCSHDDQKFKAHCPLHNKLNTRLGYRDPV